MNKRTEIISGAAAMLCHVSVTGWLFCLSQVNSNYEKMSLSIVPLCAFLIAAYLLSRILLRRGIPLSAFVAVETALCAASVFLFIRCVGLVPHKAGPVVFGSVLFAFFTVIAAFTAYSPPGKNAMLLRFDAIAIIMVLTLLANNFRPLMMLSEIMAMCFASLASLLLALILMSSERKRGTGAVSGSRIAGKMIVFGTLAAVVLVAGFIMSFALDGFSGLSALCLRALKAAGNAILSVAAYLYGALERLLLWLIEIFGSKDLEPYDTGDLAVGGTAGGDFTGGETLQVPTVFYVILGIIAAMAVAFVIYKLRRKRVTVPRYRRVYVETRRESGLREVFFKWLSKLKKGFVFYINCVRYRKTAPGLLAYCERKTHGEKARRNESGERFLLRLSDNARSPEVGEALRCLAALIERSFYSNERIAVPTGIYKTIRRARSF